MVDWEERKSKREKGKKSKDSQKGLRKTGWKISVRKTQKGWAELKMCCEREDLRSDPFCWNPPGTTRTAVHQVKEEKKKWLSLFTIVPKHCQKRRASCYVAKQVKSAKKDSGRTRGSIIKMMAVRHRQHCHSLSDDSEEASGYYADPEPEPEPEELDWDSYSTTLEHKLAAVGNSCWIVNIICVAEWWGQGWQKVWFWL